MVQVFNWDDSNCYISNSSFWNCSLLRRCVPLSNVSSRRAAPSRDHASVQIAVSGLLISKFIWTKHQKRCSSLDTPSLKENGYRGGALEVYTYNHIIGQENNKTKVQEGQATLILCTSDSHTSRFSDSVSRKLPRWILEELPGGASRGASRLLTCAQVSGSLKDCRKTGTAALDEYVLCLKYRSE